MNNNKRKRKLKKHFKSLGYSPEFIKQAIPKVLKLSKDLAAYKVQDRQETLKSLNEALQ